MPDVSAGGSGNTDTRQVILYPLFSSHDSQTFEIALNIAEGVDGRVVVLDFVEEDRSTIDESETRGQKLLQRHLEDHDVDVEIKRSESGHPLKEVVSTARRDHVRLVVFDDNTPERRLKRLYRTAAERVSAKASCDVVSVANSRDIGGVSSILVPVDEGEHATLAVVVAGALGAGVDAVVDLFHVSPAGEDTESHAADLFSAARSRLPASVDVDTWHHSGDDVGEAVIEQSSHYDVTAIGNPRQSVLTQFLTRSITEEVTEQSRNTVITATRSDGPMFSF